MAYESSIIVGGSRIVIDKPMRDFMAVYARFIKDIKSNCTGLRITFNEKIKSYQDIFPEGFDRYMFSLSMLCKTSTIPSILEAFEGAKFTGEIIFDSLMQENKLLGVNAWKETYNEVNKLKSKYEQFQRQKAARPNSYGGFVGGGTGIAGGLSGAIKASLLNMAVDAVVGTANQVNDHNTLENIYNQLTNMYDNIVKKEQYIDWYIVDARTVRSFFLTLLIDEGFLPKIKGFELNVSVKKINEIIKDSRIDSEHYNKVINYIATLIQERPYDPILYAALCMINPKCENEVLDFLSQNKMKEAFLMTRDPDYFPPVSVDSFKFTLD